MKRGPDVEWVTVSFLTLVSLGVRLSIVATGPFPINDGGLFYAFVSDLLANGMRLPDFSSYNMAGIPLVYPPLAFYVTAALHLASGIPILELAAVPTGDHQLCCDPDILRARVEDAPGKTPGPVGNFHLLNAASFLRLADHGGRHYSELRPALLVAFSGAGRPALCPRGA